MSATSIAARTLDAQPLRSLLRTFGRWHGTLVLTYHRIGDAHHSSLNRTLFSATASEFEAQLDVLMREADIVDVAEVFTRRRRAGRRVAITFDDGYRDTATIAGPLLATRELPATVFLSTGYLDRPRLAWWDELAWMATIAGWSQSIVDGLCQRYATLSTHDTEAFLDRVACAAGTDRAPASVADNLWMTWDQARELRRRGVTFGGHTVTHPVLSRCDDHRLEWEIDGCRTMLRDRLGISMERFSYPLGGPNDLDARVHAPLLHAGVRLAFDCAGGVARSHQIAALHVPRACAPIAGNDAIARVRATVGLPSVFARC